MPRIFKKFAAAGVLRRIRKKTSQHEALSNAFEAAWSSCAVSAADQGPDSDEDEPNFLDEGSGENLGCKSESEEEDMPEHENESEPSECGDIDEDIMHDIAHLLVQKLSPKHYATLLSNWRRLAEMEKGQGGKPFTRASGCSGSGMDGHGQGKVAAVLNELTSCNVNMVTRFETDNDKTKRTWLKQFSRPQFLYDDVSALKHGKRLHDFMRDKKVKFNGYGVLCYSFGFSCRDFSTENNVSKDYVQTCLADKKGSSGVTWAGNFEFALECGPALLFVENVPRLLKTQNMVFLVSELVRAGYEVSYSLRTSSDYFLPQSRKRLWLHGRKKELCSPGWSQEYQLCLDEMKHDEPLSLKQILLSSDSALLRVQRQRARRKANSKKASSRQKWRADHFVARRRSGVHEGPAVPALLAEIAEHSVLADRELDVLAVMLQKGVDFSALARQKPSLELKHSIDRVKVFSDKKTDSVSTILPGSRTVQFPYKITQAR